MWYRNDNKLAVISLRGTINNLPSWLETVKRMCMLAGSQAWPILPQPLLNRFNLLTKKAFMNLLLWAIAWAVHWQHLPAVIFSI